MLQQLLAEYAVDERRATPSAAVTHHAKRAIIDWFAALLPGAVVAPTTSLVDALTDDLGRGEAILYPSGIRTTARTAALVNGTAAHVVEFDDIFRDAIYHPGAPVIGAALATAQHVGASGSRLITAVVVGYEISTRIAVALSPAHYKYWHTTGTVGAFGAAAAAAGRDRVTPLVARKGRASYLGERSADHQDPGATSTTFLLEAAAATLS